MSTRKTRERKQVDYKEKVSMDWEDSDDEPAPSTTKKRGGKKSKVDNDEQDDAPPVKKATKKSQSKLLGALENIKLMPFDIVSEICSHLNPQDVLKLYRASALFYRLLRTPAGQSIWITARRTFGNFPTLSNPGNFTEARYASLLFEERCSICGADKARFLSGSLRMRLCGLCKHAHLMTTSQAGKLGVDEDVHPEAVNCVSYHYSSRQTFCLYLDLQRVSTTLFELQDEHDAELRQRETYERLSAGTRTRRPILVTSAPPEGPSQLEVYLEDRKERFAQRQEEGAETKVALQRYHQQDWAAYYEAQSGAGHLLKCSADYIRGRLDELGINATLGVHIHNAAKKIKIRIDQRNFEQHKAEIKKLIEAEDAKLWEDHRLNQLRWSFQSMYSQAIKKGDIETPFPLPDQWAFATHPLVFAFVKRLPQVNVFTDQMWNDNLESIAELLDLLNEHRRMHVIRLILLATTNKPYKQLSDKLCDYPPQQYGDRFFALAKHALVAPVEGAVYSWSGRTYLIDSLSSHLADPNVVWARDRLTVSQGCYNGEWSSAVGLETPVAVTVKSIIARVGWDYDTTTIEELDALGQVFDWTYRRSNFKNGTWKDVVRSVVVKLHRLSKVDIQLFDPPQITFKPTRRSASIELGLQLEIEHSGSDNEEGTQIPSDEGDDHRQDAEEELDEMLSDEE